MLRLDLNRLDRDGTVELDARIPADDPLWDGMETRFEGPVEVALRAMGAGSGEIVVRGTVEGRLRQECRRCLEPVTVPLDEEVTMVFREASEQEDEDEDDGEIRIIDPADAELDLKDAVREELVLAIDPYVVCDPECKGLCPTCGVNLNEESCDCTTDESDPRWEALRALKEE